MRKLKVKQSGALNILLGKENSLFYYEGELDPTGANLNLLLSKKFAM